MPLVLVQPTALTYPLGHNPPGGQRPVNITSLSAAYHLRITRRLWQIPDVSLAVIAVGVRESRERTQRYTCVSVPVRRDTLKMDITIDACVEARRELRRATQTYGH